MLLGLLTALPLLGWWLPPPVVVDASRHSARHSGVARARREARHRKRQR